MLWFGKPRFDSGVSSPQQDNVILINSLTTADFKDYTARRSDPISGFANLDGFQVINKYPGLIDEKPLLSLRSGMIPVPLTELAFSDKPFKYPLPQEVSVLGSESAFGELNQRIINKAVAKVQDSMTSAEKQQLDKDTTKYAEEMRQYEKEERNSLMQHYFRGPNDWPKPPQKPQSLVKYEEPIDREIERMAKRATV